MAKRVPGLIFRPETEELENDDSARVRDESVRQKWLTLGRGSSSRFSKKSRRVNVLESGIPTIDAECVYSKSTGRVGERDVYERGSSAHADADANTTGCAGGSVVDENATRPVVATAISDGDADGSHHHLRSC